LLLLLLLLLLLRRQLASLLHTRASGSKVESGLMLWILLMTLPGAFCASVCCSLISRSTVALAAASSDPGCDLVSIVVRFAWFRLLCLT